METTTNSGRKVTTFKGITVIHPHSGECSRSIVENRIKKYFTGENIPNFGTVFMSDVNYSIFVNSYSEYDNNTENFINHQFEGNSINE